MFANQVVNTLGKDRGLAAAGTGRYQDIMTETADRPFLLARPFLRHPLPPLSKSP